MNSKPQFKSGGPGSFSKGGGIQIFFSIVLRVLIKKKWVGNRRKRLYNEMYGNAV